MGKVYARGTKLWLWYIDAEGKRQFDTSGFVVGQEAKANKALEIIERRVEAEKLTGIPAGELTVKAYGEKWLKGRPEQGVSTAADEARRLRLHAWPTIGSILLKEIRTRHIRDLVRGLRTKPVRKQKPKSGAPKERGLLSPRSIHHVFATLRRMFHEAVVDELLSANPCVVKRGDLPARQDKDLEWRDTAVFTRAEAELLFSAEAIPEDRRVVNALELLAGVRGGEDAALRWRHYDESMEPLGMLTVAVNWDSRRKTLTTTKTETVRRVPVHPTLAKILAAWKLGGWERMFGRAPRPDDLIVPNQDGEHRSGFRTIRRFHADLARLQLRLRRKHDCRRTFISLARADGARIDLLKLVTHGPPRGVMDLYSTIPFEALCAEVSKLRLELRQGAKVLEIRQVVNGVCDSPCDSPLAEMKKPPSLVDLGAKKRGGATVNRANTHHTLSPTLADNSAEELESEDSQDSPGRTAGNPTVTTVTDAIGAALADARVGWAERRDAKELRKRLAALLLALDDEGGES